MARKFQLFNVYGLRVSASMGGVLAFLAIWLLTAVIAAALIQLPLLDSIIGGFLAALLHYVSDMLHQLGHAVAARRTGHPMSGVYFWGIFGASLYPKDEGELPGRVHIQRALGGPLASFAGTIVAGLLLALVSAGGLLWWLLLFTFVDNLLVFALGALFPIRLGDFVTDGATILYWRSRL
ncbi:MAG: hypothetical protein U0694_29400 [Anaerolineae bacterium]